MTTKKTTSKPFACLECGRRFSLKAAERAMSSDQGCPGCGGADIDLHVETLSQDVRK